MKLSRPISGTAPKGGSDPRFSPARGRGRRSWPLGVVLWGLAAFYAGGSALAPAFAAQTQPAKSAAEPKSPKTPVTLAQRTALEDSLQAKVQSLIDKLLGKGKGHATVAADIKSDPHPHLGAVKVSVLIDKDVPFEEHRKLGRLIPDAIDLRPDRGDSITLVVADLAPEGQGSRCGGERNPWAIGCVLLLALCLVETAALAVILSRRREP